jgi:hypothetical protein
MKVDLNPKFMKNLNAFLLICLCIAFNSCDKCKGVDCFSPVNTFMFKIVNQDLKNISDKVDSVRFVYVENGVSKIITPKKVINSTNEVLFTTNDIGWITIDKLVSFDLQIKQISKGILIMKHIKVNKDCCTYFEMEILTFKDKSILKTVDKDYSFLLNID